MTHLILVTKYRKQLLIRYGNQIKQTLNDIAKEKDFEIIEMEVDKDHIHLLVSYNPMQSILDTVILLKQMSTYRIWRQSNNHILVKTIWEGKNILERWIFCLQYRKCQQRDH